MTNIEEAQLETVEEIARDAASLPNPQKRNKAIWIVIAGLVIVWFIIRPGVFTVQPIGALPEGVTIVYHSRNPDMPFFSSPDGLCLQMQGGVSLLCRMTALGAAGDLTDRIILRLPYSHWAYLRSTGGLEFDQ
jgi:hypothetical protein